MRTSIELPFLLGVISAKNQHLTFGCLRHDLLYFFLLMFIYTHAFVISHPFDIWMYGSHSDVHSIWMYHIMTVVTMYM